MEHINTLCRKNAELFNIKAGGIFSYYCALMGKGIKGRDVPVLN
jgi:hypothetical protein